MPEIYVDKPKLKMSNWKKRNLCKVLKRWIKKKNNKVLRIGALSKVFTLINNSKQRQTLKGALPTPIKEKETHWLRKSLFPSTAKLQTRGANGEKKRKRKVYASQRPRAIREEPLTKVRGLTRRPST
eukprot:899156-Pelagomonas_calceolata.AAC.4